MKKLRLKYNKKGILKIVSFMLIILSTINFRTVPKTNAYFSKEEESILALNGNLYKVNEVKIDIKTIFIDTNDNIKVTFTGRQSNNNTRKKYSITCGSNTVSGLEMVSSERTFENFNCGKVNDENQK